MEEIIKYDNLLRITFSHTFIGSINNSAKTGAAILTSLSSVIMMMTTDLFLETEALMTDTLQM